MKAIYLINNFDKKNPIFFVAELKDKVDNFVNVTDDTVTKKATITGFGDANLQKILSAVKTKVNFTDINIAKQKVTISSDSVGQKLSKQGQKFTVVAIFVKENNERVGLLLVDDNSNLSTITTEKLVKAMEKKTTNVTNMYVRDGALVLYDDNSVPNIILGKRVIEDPGKDDLESNGDLVDFYTIGTYGTIEKDISMIRNQPDRIKGKLDKERVWRIFKICKPNELDIESGNYEQLAKDFVKNLMPYQDILDNYSEVSFEKVKTKLKKFVKEVKSNKNFLEDYKAARAKNVSYKDVII